MDSWVLVPVTVILSVSFVGWLIWRAVKKKPIKIHLVMYGLSALTGIICIVFFMTMMDIPAIAKVLGGVVLGGVFIFLGARMQRRRQQSQP